MMNITQMQKGRRHSTRIPYISLTVSPSFIQFSIICFRYIGHLHYSNFKSSSYIYLYIYIKCSDDNFYTAEIKTIAGRNKK